MKAKPQSNETKVSASHQPGDWALIPLHLLVRSPYNVRKNRGGGIAELAALIQAQGVLENLLVHPEVKKKRSTGNYGVAAGDRRFQALELLASRNLVAPDHGVPCLIISEERAVELSLAENCHEPMHPADEFEAFKTMIDNGKTIEETAATFGVSPLVVQRRLKLANVSPRMLALYREGDEKITLDHLMAMAITDDHAAQERAWDSLQPYNRQPHNLRRLLTENEIDSEDNALALYVGIDEYERAGGRVRRDLFSDDGAGYIEDATLLESLALTKLEAVGEAIKAEGWAWVDIRTHFDHSELCGFGYAQTVQRELTAAEGAKLNELTAARDKLSDEMESFDGNDEEYTALDTRMDSLNEEIEALEETFYTYAPEVAAICGVIVTLGHRGNLDVRRGLIRAEDKKKARGQTAGENTEEAPKPTHSERLTRQLTAQRTAALQAALSIRPDVALVVLTHRLASQVFHIGFFGSAAQVVIHQPDLAREAMDLEQSRAWASIAEQREAWEKRLPVDDEDGFFAWLLEQPQDDVLALLAFCTACTINTVQSNEAIKPEVNSLAKALALDMADWWTPTRDSYLGHVPKSRLVKVVSEAVSTEAAQPISGMKKEDAIKAAGMRLDGTRWLPEPLRMAATAA